MPERRKTNRHAFRESDGQIKRLRRIAGHDRPGPDHRPLLTARDDLGILRLVPIRKSESVEMSEWCFSPTEELSPRLNDSK